MNSVESRFRMIVDFLRDHDASDISLFRSNVTARLDGQMIRLSEDGALSSADVELMIRHLLILYSPNVSTAISHSIDFSLTLFDRRFRVNIAKSRGELFASMRPLPGRIPEPAHIGLSTLVMRRILSLSHGLILVTGPTGSGKTTTIASMVEMLNQNRQAKIIAIEDPVEFEFESKQSEVIQREVGQDVANYEAGLRDSLRQNPDIIVVGEVRDPETALVALQAAETGHLVIASLHANSVVEAVSRYLLLGPKERSDEIRYVLARTMRVISNQRLFRRREKGRVAVREICVHAPNVEAVIMKSNEQELNGYMLAGRDQGMIDFQSALRALKGVIDPQEYAAALRN
jgi:twitching motility protein PilT